MDRYAVKLGCMTQPISMASEQTLMVSHVWPTSTTRTPAITDSLSTGSHVKYISTAPGAFRGAVDNRTFETILLSELLPPFPPGHWNKGHVARDPETGKATFVKTEKVQFAAVGRLVHPVKFNELDFTQQYRVETAAYQWLSDSRVGPEFLGHLTKGKDGRVVSFVAEWVEGARAAGPRDINGCKKALARLHELGIKFGDMSKHNFLVRDGHDVIFGRL
ncbi:hypothetical protein ACRE_036720 [Hapsidospora chrysogenum ATCC 11550]|uniref:Aminoglycoside phosphotransferase domain-containing protein n=1 Tax=Hapsidospora chrysogenum (strain ATCC 11550 / CBS 779.69 / DSM 880 / IAM 14645 / JCM 23072 / IMI 49137) TaxID=857340 RepID=A0A086T7Z0_HAPC1|nr:hypothetical protein ACRE_036720 [Hapsidospora chrysogenum ATCC 11550]